MKQWILRWYEGLRQRGCDGDDDGEFGTRKHRSVSGKSEKGNENSLNLLHYPHLFDFVQIVIRGKNRYLINQL